MSYQQMARRPGSPNGQTNIGFRLDETKIAYGQNRYTNFKLLIRYLFFKIIDNQKFTNLATSALAFLLKHRIAPKLIVLPIFKIFCGGKSLFDCKPIFEELGNFGIGSVPDYSVEGESNIESGLSFDREILKCIETATANSNISQTVFKISAFESPDFLTRVSDKIQSKSKFEKQDILRFEKLLVRIDKICEFAHAHNIQIMIDAEETWMQYAIDEIAIKMMEKYNRSKCIVINTYQMYTKLGLDKLKSHHEHISNMDCVLGVKLVRGAYMEKENKRAISNNENSPIHNSKKDTDRAFNDGIEYCIENINEVFLFVGTHNEDSLYKLMNLMNLKGLPNNINSIFISQLYGMGDNISYNMANNEYNVTKYLPYGDIKDCVPYLIRRAQENSSASDMSSRELEMLRIELRRRKFNSPSFQNRRLSPA